MLLKPCYHCMAAIAQSYSALVYKGRRSPRAHHYPREGAVAVVSSAEALLKHLIIIAKGARAQSYTCRVFQQ